MSDCQCPTLPTKPFYKSFSNWFVTLPILLLGILQFLPDALHDPTVAANNPLGSGTTKMILFGVAILNFYLRNIQKQSTITFRKVQPNPEQPLTNKPPDVILNSDGVQPPNTGYRISNEIPKEAGGPNG
jgi:hypothetical protein